MGPLFAVLAVIGETSAKTVDKLNYRKNHVGVRQQMLLTFLGMTVSLLAFTLLTTPSLPEFTLVSIGLLCLVALVSFIGNVFDELSLKVNDLSLRQPMMSFQPVLTGFIGYWLFPAERKPAALIALVLASFVVAYGSSRRKLGKIQARGVLLLLLAVITYSFIPSLYKATLEYVDPAYIALFRTTVILSFTYLLIKGVRQKYTGTRVRFGLTSGVLYAATTVFDLYAIKHIGVVQTMLLWLLGSGLMYLVSYFFLKEKVRGGEVVSSVLLALIALAAIAL